MRCGRYVIDFYSLKEPELLANIRNGFHATSVLLRPRKVALNATGRWLSSAKRL